MSILGGNGAKCIPFSPFIAIVKAAKLHVHASCGSLTSGIYTYQLYLLVICS